MPVARLGPDLIVVNALIRTLDSADTIAQALAVKDGRIVAVGASR
jgi:predicted amidohydrolase YtcJ